MKITRRQLRKIIMKEVSAKEIGDAAAKGAKRMKEVPEAMLGVIAIHYHAGKGVLDVVRAKKAATSKFMQDVLSRALSRSLKRSKNEMSKEDVAKAHKAITSRDGDAIIGSIKAGFLSLDLNDLQDVYKDLKKSASAERVDFDAVEKMLKKLRDVA